MAMDMFQKALKFADSACPRCHGSGLEGWPCFCPWCESGIGPGVKHTLCVCVDRTIKKLEDERGLVRDATLTPGAKAVGVEPREKDPVIGSHGELPIHEDMNGIRYIYLGIVNEVAYWPEDNVRKL